MDKTIKTFCFDFDGTIANTLPLIIRTANRLLRQHKEEEISDQMLRQIREEGIEATLKKAGVPLYKLAFLYFKMKKEMSKEISEITVTDEMKETIKALKSKGFRIGVLTSNSKENVDSFLKKNDINIFDFITSSGVLNKKKVIKKFKQKGGIFIYIGDEPRDITAGKKAGVKTVAVLWGLSSRKALVKARPDIIIEKPSDLTDLSF